MKLYHLHRTQQVPISLQEAWDFFSDPSNLAKITPDSMGFQVVSGTDKKVYGGQLIEYIVSPLFNIPMKWVTHITQVQEPLYFVDEQLVGPYKFWHHEHRFREIAGGVEVEDKLTYAVPMGILGRIAHPILVKGKIEEIFAYRNKRLIELFGAFDTQKDLIQA